VPVRLTDPFVASLQAKGQRLEVADELVSGLRLRVSPTGVKSWCVWFRSKAGKPERFTLGAYPKLTLSKARKRAKDKLAEVQLGGNPAEDLRKSRLRAERDEKTSIRALAPACIADLTLRPSTRKEWSRLAEAEIVKAFGARQAADLTRAEIREWCESIRDGERSWRDDGGQAAPYTANRAFELLRRVYSWAVGKDLLAASPFVGLELPSEEAQSERVLSRDELRALLRALDACPREHEAYRALWAFYADATRLLLLTCVRRAAVLGLRRGELEDLDGAEPRWAIPGGAEGRSKSGRAHVVPLSPPALAVIRRRLTAVRGEYLFPVNRYHSGEDRPASWPSGYVADLRAETLRQLRAELLDEKATIPKWRVHDLRHTAATHLREDLGVSSEVVSHLLGHTPPGARVTRVYNRAELLPERRAALVAWGAWLERLAAGEAKGADIRPMRRRR
jgi:integrase